MKKIKRLGGIIILSFCGIVAMTEVVFIQVLIEQTKDIFTLLGIGVILVVAIIIFFLVKLGLRLLHNSTLTDSIDQIGQ